MYGINEISYSDYPSKEGVYLPRKRVTSYALYSLQSKSHGTFLIKFNHGITALNVAQPPQTISYLCDIMFMVITRTIIIINVVIVYVRSAKKNTFIENAFSASNYVYFPV